MTKREIFRLIIIASGFFQLLIAVPGLSQGAHSSEIGVRYGNFTLLGDVDHAIFPGWGAGVFYQKALNAVVSLRPSVYYGVTHGLDASPTTDNILQEPTLFEGYSVEQPWFFAYECRLFRLYLQSSFELSNLGPEKKDNQFNYYILLGAGINSYGTWLNLRDEQDLPYSELLTRTGYNTSNDFNTSQGRKNIRNTLESIYDDTYETPAFKQVGKFRLGDETNIDTEVSIGAGIAYKLSSSLSFSLEHEYIFIPSDYLDGQRWRTQQDATVKSDVGQFTSIGFAYRLNGRQKASPLNWVNPWLLEKHKLDSLQAQIDSLQLAIGDEDGDGVINAMDKQPSSKPNCPVDVNGVTSDLDRDGIPDCHDKYPFIDKSEIESVIAQALEEDRQQMKQLEALVQSNVNTQKSAHNGLTGVIYFEQDSDEISPEQMAELAQLVFQMIAYPVSCITVTGHADDTFETPYNDDLGQRRANQVSRAMKDYFGLTKVDIQIRSQGELNPLMVSGPGSMKNYVNRRVEIRVCK